MLVHLRLGKMSDEAYEWFVFVGAFLAIFAALFILIGNKIAQKQNNRVSAGVICVGLTYFLIIALLKRPELLEFLHERAALYCLGLVVVTVSVIGFLDRH